MEIDIVDTRQSSARERRKLVLLILGFKLFSQRVGRPMNTALKIFDEIQQRRPFMRSVDTHSS